MFIAVTVVPFTGLVVVHVLGGVGAMSDIVHQILVTEKKAAEIVENAEKEKEKTIVQARKKALEVFTQQKKVIEQRIDQDVKKRLAVVEQRKHKILADYAAQARALGERAEKHVPHAVKLVVRKILDGELLQ